MRRRPLTPLATLTNLSWFALIAGVLVLASCDRDRIAARVESPSAEQTHPVAVGHSAGSNLPPWAACWFPHRANGEAIARAQPCPSETSAIQGYAASDVSGCWSIRTAAGDTLLPFLFGGPIYLTEQLAEGQQPASGGSPVLGVESAAPADSAHAAWRRVSWHITPPDSLTIRVSVLGLGGPLLSFRIRGDTLVGMLQTVADDVALCLDSGSASVLQMVGRRTRCHPAA